MSDVVPDLGEAINKPNAVKDCLFFLTVNQPFEHITYHLTIMPALKGHLSLT